MKITACVITKNEEKTLPTCLDSVKSIVSEIIVVDTGSTDRTVEIAKSYGAKVFTFEWINDFAAARNYAIEQAKSDWIIFLDADEFFAPDCVKYVTGAIKEANQKKLDMIICMMSNIEQKTGKIISSNLHIRIFRNHPQIRYVGAIHERIVRLDIPAKALDVQKDITIIHTGYSEENLNLKEKGKRNLELLFKELENRPNSFDVLFYISESYLVDKQFEQALDFAMRAQQYRNSDLKGIYEKNYVNIFQCLIHLEKPREVVFQTMLEAIKEFPHYPDFHLYLGDYYKKANRYRDAIQSYQRGLQLMDQSSHAQSSSYATAAKVVDTVGHLYSKLKEWNQCVNYHVQALQLDKYLYSSLVNLMSVLGRFEKPDNVLAFFTKMYDMNSMKDCLYLLRASLNTNNTMIASILLEKMPKDHPSLKEYVAQYDFLIGKYNRAYSIFLNLYQQTEKVEYAYGALAAAWKQKYPSSYSELQSAFANEIELNQLVANIFEESSQLTIDKKNMYMFLIYMSGTLKITEFHTLIQIVKRSNLLLEMGHYLYQQENYVDAYQFYNEFLEQGQRIPEDMLADITYKVGDCLLQNGLDEHAWGFLEKAHSLAPQDFRIYESLIYLAKKMNRLQDINNIWETAMGYYPDSYFLRTVFQDARTH